MRKLCFMMALLLSLFATPSCLMAIPPDERLSNPAQESRAVALGEQLRCLVCQSESINDSPSELSRDLRLLVRDRIQKGWQDQQILDYIHDRLGDGVLLKPPVKFETMALWMVPWIILSIGLIVFIVYWRKNKTIHNG